MALPEFRTQYIVDAISYEVVAAEVLFRNPSALKFDDPDFMLQHDVKALRFAGEFYSKTAYRTRCNVEPSTIINGLDQMLKVAVPGVVVELVERNQNLVDEALIRELAQGCCRLRKAGYLIAMDDVTPTELEIELIKQLKPDYIKVENRMALDHVRRVAPNHRLIAERVETEMHAKLAVAMGVQELQGFWLDDVIAQRMNTKVRAFAC